MKSLRLVYQFDQGGEIVQVHPSPRSVAESTGLTYKIVTRRLRTRGTFQHREHEYSYSQARPRIPLRRTPSKKVQGQRVQDGELVLFSSIKEAARTLDITRSSIIMVLQGKRRTAGGYIWERVG